jgi:hypothetical protein
MKVALGYFQRYECMARSWSNCGSLLKPLPDQLQQYKGLAGSSSNCGSTLKSCQGQLQQYEWLAVSWSNCGSTLKSCQGQLQQYVLLENFGVSVATHEDRPGLSSEVPVASVWGLSNGIILRREINHVTRCQTMLPFSLHWRRAGHKPCQGAKPNGEVRVFAGLCRGGI